MQLFLIPIPPSAIDQNVYSQLLSHLSEEAQARIKKYRLPEDSLRSLVGRLAPIWYLRKHDLLGGRRPVFGIKAQGKPILIEPVLEPPLAFNTSHDGQYVLLGISHAPNADIGVDLMRHPDNPWEIQEAIMDQLSREEKLALAMPLTTPQRAELLTTLWSFKEGYVKATGDGIGFGLERIALDLAPDGRVHLVYVDGRDVKLDGWEWDYGTIEAGADSKPYGWAVFWKGKAGEVEVQRVQWEEFIAPFMTHAQS